MKNHLERPITVKELGEALFELENQKVPGCDGIPLDIIKMLWHQLGELLLEVYVEAIEKGELHLSA